MSFVINAAVICIILLSCIMNSLICDTRFIYYQQHHRAKRNTTEDNCPAFNDTSMDSRTQEEFMQFLTHSCRYDHLVRPLSSQPLQVYFQIDVKHMETVDNTQFLTHLLVQIYFRDERLRFSDISPDRSSIVGQETLKEKLWIPHVFIKNEKSSGLMGLDRKDVYIKITPEGDVIYSYRMTTTFYCAMNLRKFPFDHQTCQVTWSSWAYNESSMELRWSKTNPYILSENLQLTEFSLESITVEEYKSSISNASITGWGEDYSSLTFTLKLKREAGYYVLEYFLPSVFLVVMSWVSFWIQADAAPARTVLGTSTMLSFITLNGNLMKDLPKVSYIKASEVWFFGGATFIFCSLAEFAFVNVIWRRKKKVEMPKPTGKYIITGAISPRMARKSNLKKSESFSSFDAKQGGTYLVHGSSNSLNIPTINVSDDQNGESGHTSPSTSQQPQPQTWTEMTPQEVAIWIDRKARIVFPLMFLVYNFIYWIYVYCL